MQISTLELMHDQVRAIYRAMTGDDLPETDDAESIEESPSVDEVARRFVDLEMLARQLPTVIERVPPFSFEPAFDAIETRDHLIVEFAVPGIVRDDVAVECGDGVLIVSGTRGGERAADGRHYHHAEIPRGPFHRSVRLPCAVSSEVRVEVKAGLIRIQLNKASAKGRDPSDRGEWDNVQGE